MSQLVPLKDAAQMLGVSPEELTEMISKNEIFGYRDGASWKFKSSEIERVASELGKGLSGSGQFKTEGESSDLNLVTDDEEDDKTIQLDPGSLTTDDSIQLSDELELALEDDSSASSDLKLSSSDEISLGSSEEIQLSDESEKLEFGTSDLAIAAKGGSDVLDEELQKGDSPSDTGRLLDEELQLSEEDLFDDELTFQDSKTLEDDSDISSDFEDSDLVIQDSSSSEVTVESDSEFEISDSAMEGSSGEMVGGSSDLSGDDSFADALELEEVDEESDSGSVAEDDDFNLTPLEDSFEDSSSSQVIALDDSSIYSDDSASTLLAESGDLEEQPAMLTQEPEEAFDDSLEPISGYPAVAGPPEAAYSIWNVMGLAAALLLVALTTMVAFDLARSMWQPSGTILTDTVANFFVELFGFESGES